VPGIDEKPMPLKKIGILGAGLMGPDALITDQREEKFGWETTRRSPAPSIS